MRLGLFGATAMAVMTSCPNKISSVVGVVLRTGLTALQFAASFVLLNSRLVPK